MISLAKSPNDPVRILGHRGAMGHAPENTMASFQAALEMGADMIEFDVHLSRDKVPVVIHDENISRTTDGEGEVRNLSLEQLKRVDAGSWFSDKFIGQRIPTLEEVVSWAKGRIPVNIEIKNGPNFYPQIERLVIEALDQHGIIEETIISSFDHVCLKTIKELEPRLKTAILYSCRLYDPISYARRLNLSAFHPRWNYLTPEFIQTAHASGLAVNTWVANSSNLMETLVGLGVDMIGTNYPDRLKALLSPA